MGEIRWEFPLLGSGNKQGYTNSGIETFRGEELMDNLAREICQNSLDAKDPSKSNAPVIVKFNLRHMNQDKYEMFQGYTKSIQGCKRFWEGKMDDALETFLRGVENTLKEDTIPILVVGDYNTLGLTGSKCENENTVWEALTSSDGVNVKQGSSGGSYGIGKNAPFACSSLSTVFYKTYATDGIRAFQGVARLATLYNEDNKATQSVGKYLNKIDDDTWSPIFRENSNSFRDEFIRDEYGTDIIILGFDQVNDWQNTIKKAVIRNFLMAIYNDNLVIHIEDEIITSKKLSSLLLEYSDDPKMRQTYEIYQALIKPDIVKKYTIIENDDVKIFLKSDKDYKKTIARFRSTGMLINTYYHRILQNYAAIVHVMPGKLDNLLRATEPPKHDKWDHALIKDEIIRAKARKAIKRIKNEVLELLRGQYEDVKENVVDSGLGEYLPDEVDDLGSQKSGDDILNVNQKIWKKESRTNTKTYESVQGKKKNTGGKSGGMIFNPNLEPKPPNPSPHPHPKPGDNPKKTGVVPGNGRLRLVIPKIKKQRLFEIASNQGIYKLIINSEYDYKNVYIKFSAIGEDGSHEAVEVDSYTIENHKYKANDSRIGPIRLVKDNHNVLFITFKTNEKMLLSTSIVEEVNYGN